MLNQNKQIGGEPVHVRDCYIWAEIYYLDSPTDYREYLPQDTVPTDGVPRDGVVVLDSPTQWSTTDLQGGWTNAELFLVASGVILCILPYLLG